ncbi:regulator of ribonuclease activity A [Oikeobacillus pervagus]|uniref:4-hydroxy-4-methyl-2-oxoglutarate aldolase n=1 Tax=Oikeobacillus pervagus TaxID=1325931 RepID=A0AAJ1WKN1_9BACI|nr:ribonuclease E activity regulator RraA [Oikeobacillus pervagus]MDQ0216708.1 regulator of ribonuclease activity A [Oikeobacillus pervagus]
MSIKTADLCDDFASELQVCSLEFKSFGKNKSFSGPIATVSVFEDNVLVKEALKTIPEGSVLVVDGGGSKKCALMGDRLGDIAETRKLAGVIINGCVRDTADLGQQNIGVFAIGSNPLKSIKEGKGDRDVTLKFGDVEWTPGHYVYADEDGVVVAARKLN